MALILHYFLYFRPLFSVVEQRGHFCGDAHVEERGSDVDENLHSPDVLCVYDEGIVVKTVPDAPVVGVDVGIANFLTTSTGRHYGTMDGDF